MRKYVVIVAGGKGIRMGTDIPKQFLLLNNKPVLMHTIEKFYAYDPAISIIVVLPEFQINYWKSKIEEYRFEIKHQIVSGGSERFYSVQNGLSLITDHHSVVAIHDGVRPGVSIDTIARCFDVASKNGSAIPVIPLNDTIRQLTEEGSKHVDRSKYRLVQTPQTFKAEYILKAYLQEWNSNFTDDASVLETTGMKICLVEGNSENIKVTSPLDLIVLTHLVI